MEVEEEEVEVEVEEVEVEDRFDVEQNITRYYNTGL